jgi:hypothetical protein
MKACINRYFLYSILLNLSLIGYVQATDNVGATSKMICRYYGKDQSYHEFAVANSKDGTIIPFVAKDKGYVHNIKRNKDLELDARMVHVSDNDIIRITGVNIHGDWLIEQEDVEVPEETILSKDIKQYITYKTQWKATGRFVTKLTPPPDDEFKNSPLKCTTWVYCSSQPSGAGGCTIL